MDEYTRKDIICFTDDLRLDSTIGKKVYGADCLTDLLLLANHGNPDVFCGTLAIIHKDANSRPFSIYVGGPWNDGYRHYDAIIIKKDDDT